MNEKVSVIIPTYNRSECLERAINSVLMQTYKNIEIIVVDDNDADSIYREKNENKLRSYINKKQIIYIKHKKNKNGAAARNTGIKNSSGDYITFLDDDDYFLPTRIEKLVHLLNNNDKYDAAYSSVLFKKNNRVYSKKNAIKTGNLKLELLNQDSFFGTGSNMFFRKRIINKIGFFDENFIRHQDIEYMIRFFDYGNIIAINEPLVVKCIDSNNNFPDYDKFLTIKKIFFHKFENDIKNYARIEQKRIYFNNYLEILYSSVENKSQYDYIISTLQKYGKIGYKIKLKFYYLKGKRILKKIIRKKK